MKQITEYERVAKQAVQELALRMMHERVNSRDELESLAWLVAVDVTSKLSTKQLLRMAMEESWMAEFPITYKFNSSDTSARAAIRSVLILCLQTELVLNNTPAEFYAS